MTVHNYICIIYIPDIHVSMSVQIHTHTHTVANSRARTISSHTTFSTYSPQTLIINNNV